MSKSKSTKDESYQSDTEEVENVEELENDNAEGEEDEKEYESGSDQNSEEDEEKEDEQEAYNDENELLEAFYEEENDETAELEGEEENEMPEESADAGNDENDFEEKRKRTTTKNRKDVKRRLFPFIQKDRRLARANERDSPEYFGVDIRELTVGFLEQLGGLTKKGCSVMENAIHAATPRYFQYMGRNIPEDDSIEFKRTYWDILRHVVGAWNLMSKKEILEEVKTDRWGLKSKLFIKAQETEQLLEQKIKQPDEVTEDSNYPCPKCRGIRHTRLRVQDRSGDEAGSLRLWCANSACGHGWRITG